MRGLLPSALAGLLVALLAAPAAAQVGRIAGTVRDDGGRGVRGATVTASNPDNFPSSFTATTDGRGRYGLLGLSGGTWLVTVQAPGFEPARQQVAVSSRGAATLDVTLKPGTTAPAGPLAGIRADAIQNRLDEAGRREASGDLNAALEIYREIAARIPALSTVHLQIGVLHEQLGERAAALDAYRRVLDADPDNETARRAITRLEQSSGGQS